MNVYYNEIDPYCVSVLKDAISRGVLHPGVVDSRDIRDISHDEIKSFNQCHFFTGIGVWPYVLKQLNVPTNIKLDTGSCPCQPFSSVGKRLNVLDDRHLWPFWFKLINKRNPRVILGEQVAGGDGLLWWDEVSSDLEKAFYSQATTDICSAGFGADHLRQRLYWVAHSRRERVSGLCIPSSARPSRQGRAGGTMDLQQIIDRPYNPGINYPQPLVRGTDIAPSERINRLRAYGNSLDYITCLEYVNAVDLALTSLVS